MQQTHAQRGKWELSRVYRGLKGCEGVSWGLKGGSGAEGDKQETKKGQVGIDRYKLGPGKCAEARVLGSGKIGRFKAAFLWS